MRFRGPIGNEGEKSIAVLWASDERYPKESCSCLLHIQESGTAFGANSAYLSYNIADGSHSIILIRLCPALASRWVVINAKDALKEEQEGTMKRADALHVSGSTGIPARMRIFILVCQNQFYRCLSR